MRNRNIALIFAGGSGKRMGSDIPKQFLEWGGKTILIQTIECFENYESIDSILVVSKIDWIEKTNELIKKYNIKKVISVIPGGETALDSQYLGLKKIKEIYDDNCIVLIHDGVRPLLDNKTIKNNIEGVKKYGSAITVTKCIETVIDIDNDHVSNVTQDRSKCRMAKAPQSFYLKDILDVHEKSIRDGKRYYIDSASMMFDYGYELHVVDGNQENIKITTPSDYYMYLGIRESRKNER